MHFFLLFPVSRRFAISFLIGVIASPFALGLLFAVASLIDRPPPLTQQEVRKQEVLRLEQERREEAFRERYNQEQKELSIKALDTGKWLELQREESKKSDLEYQQWKKDFCKKFPDCNFGYGHGNAN